MNNIQISEHFNLLEFQCPCCNTVKINKLLLSLLSRLRWVINKPIYIKSGYRCPAENEKINGDRNSYHMKGMAVDIYVENFYLESLGSNAVEVGFTGIGYYTSKNFIHLDVRPGKLKSWKE